MKIFCCIFFAALLSVSIAFATNTYAKDTFILTCTNHKNKTEETYTLEFMRNRQVAMVYNEIAMYLFEYSNTNDLYGFHKFKSMDKNKVGDFDLHLNFESGSHGEMVTFWGHDNYMRSCK